MAKDRKLRPKALSSRNVLTNSPWTFVSLWLKRNRKPAAALFYWEQANEFYKAGNQDAHPRKLLRRAQRETIGLNTGAKGLGWHHDILLRVNLFPLMVDFFA